MVLAVICPVLHQVLGIQNLQWKISTEREAEPKIKVTNFSWCAAFQYTRRFFLADGLAKCYQLTLCRSYCIANRINSELFREKQWWKRGDNVQHYQKDMHLETATPLSKLYSSSPPLCSKLERLKPRPSFLHQQAESRSGLALHGSLRQTFGSDATLCWHQSPQLSSKIAPPTSKSDPDTSTTAGFSSLGGTRSSPEELYSITKKMILAKIFCSRCEHQTRCMEHIVVNVGLYKNN